MPDYLWTFASQDGNPCPILVPAGTTSSTLADMASQNVTPMKRLGSLSYGGGTTFAAVDVVNNFYWTASKLGGSTRQSRQEVPYVRLKERKVKTSSFIAQALYSTGGIFDSGNAVLKAVNANFSLPSKGVDPQAIKSKLTELINGVPGSQDSSLTQSLLKKIGQVTDAVTDDESFLTDEWLRYYKGLYITQPTGWVYFLPYMGNEYQTTGNSWGSDSGGSGGQMLIAGASKLVEGFGEFARKLESELSVGSYQEKPQFFQFAQTGEQINVSFPLINTGNASFNDVIKNWQFIFLLLYQNRAQRIDRNVVEPPPIYEVEIPGLKYMPLSYISDIKVDFKGARRTMALPLPSSTGGNTVLNTIVPEAYQINLTIQSLVTESRNFMYSAATKQNNITVMTATEAAGLNQLNNLYSQINKVVQNPLRTLEGLIRR